MKPCSMLCIYFNKHFFTKSCYHLTYQSYEESPQKLGTFLENKIFERSNYSNILKVGLIVQYSLKKKKLERLDQFFDSEECL